MSDADQPCPAFRIWTNTIPGASISGRRPSSASSLAHCVHEPSPAPLDVVKSLGNSKMLKCGGIKGKCQVPGGCPY